MRRLAFGPLDSGLCDFGLLSCSGGYSAGFCPWRCNPNARRFCGPVPPPPTNHRLQHVPPSLWDDSGARPQGPDHALSGLSAKPSARPSNCSVDAREQAVEDLPKGITMAGSRFRRLEATVADPPPVAVPSPVIDLTG